MVCGILESATLVPILFGINMKPLEEIIRGFRLDAIHADDGSISPFLQILISYQGPKSLVENWMETNKLKLNLDPQLLLDHKVAAMAKGAFSLASVDTL